jgi:hypothetical protein
MHVDHLYVKNKKKAGFRPTNEKSCSFAPERNLVRPGDFRQQVVKRESGANPELFPQL